MENKIKSDETPEKRDDSLSTAFDDDLNQMSWSQVVAEVKRLRQGIRQHRDSTGHALCWYHPELWGLLPEVIDLVKPIAPPWPEFVRCCVQYRNSLDSHS